jgi:hypothetical protein
VARPHPGSTITGDAEREAALCHAEEADAARPHVRLEAVIPGQHDVWHPAQLAGALGRPSLCPLHAGMLSHRTFQRAIQIHDQPAAVGSVTPRQSHPRHRALPGPARRSTPRFKFKFKFKLTRTGATQLKPSHDGPPRLPKCTHDVLERADHRLGTSLRGVLRQAYGHTASCTERAEQ